MKAPLSPLSDVQSVRFVPLVRDISFFEPLGINTCVQHAAEAVRQVDVKTLIHHMVTNCSLTLSPPLLSLCASLI